MNEASQATETTFWIMDCRTPEFEARLQKLARKAAKIGVEAPSYETLTRKLVPSRPQRLDEDPEDVPRVMRRQVRLTGVDQIRVKGFRLIGRVEPSPVKGVNFVHGAPGTTEDEYKAFRRKGLSCDFCHTKRARKNSYIIEDTASRTRHLVGRNCLAAFIGSPDASSLGSFGDAIREFSEDVDGWGMSGGRDEWLPLRGWLSLVAALVDQHGWISAGAAYDDDSLWATKDRARAAWYRTGSYDRCHGRKALAVPDPTDEQMQAVGDAVEWIRTVSPDPLVTTSEYLLNLRLACELDHFDVKNAGLVSSLLTAHWRAKKNEEKEQQRAEAKATAGPVPVTEERVTVEGEVTAARWKATDFGETLKITVRSADGWSVYGTCPRPLVPEAATELIGKRVQFMARVSPSHDDKTFGFFQRPTKAQSLNAA